MGELLQWHFVIDNRPGAGNLGLDLAAKAAPDGYTIVMGESSNLAINPSLYSKLPFDPTKDVAAVALVGTVPQVLVVSASAPRDSLAALIDAARRRQLTFASSGNGTVGHLVGEMWRRAIGVDMVHMPYKGAGQVMIDLVGGQVDLHFASLPAALPLIERGKPRRWRSPRRNGCRHCPASRRSPSRAFRASSTACSMASWRPPARRPLNGEIDRALRSTDLRKGLSERGVDVRAGTPEQFDAFLAAERAKWASAVKTSGATVD